MMKISYKKEFMEFENLVEGGLFKSKNSMGDTILCIKLQETITDDETEDKYNAVSVINGALYWFENEEEVEPIVKSELIIYYN